MQSIFVNVLELVVQLISNLHSILSILKKLSPIALSITEGINFERFCDKQTTHPKTVPQWTWSFPLIILKILKIKINSHTSQLPTSNSLVLQLDIYRYSL